MSLPRFAGALFYVVSVGSLLAVDKIDLKRLTPVPATEQIPVSDFFRLPLLGNPKLNPAGTHIAANITAGEDKENLLVYELKTKKAEVASGWGQQEIGSINWLDDRKFVFQMIAGKMYGVALFAADVDEISRAYPLLQYYGSQLIGVPQRDRLRPLVWNAYNSLEGGVHHDLGVSSIDAALHHGGPVRFLNGASASVDDVASARESNARHIVRSFPQPGPGRVEGYLADQEGQLAFTCTLNNGIPVLQRLVGEEWVQCPIDLDQIDVIGCGDRPGELVVLGPRQEGKPRALQFMDATSGQLGEALLQDEEYDFNGRLYRHPATNQILGVSFTRNGPETFWFSEQYRKLQKLLDAQFRGQAVQILGSNVAQKIFLVATFSDRQPPVYHCIDLEKHTADLFKNSAPWIDPARMQPESILKFTTRDGHQLVAYLTLPSGASKTNLPPLVVLPHGGPWARDSWGFNPEAQFLASRGYAVLTPNYRGSTGSDWRFPVEDRFDFIKMQDDVTDATKAAVDSGKVDGSRIGIMGASFGGYLAVGGAVREPSLYRCAITNAGVFDWASLIRDKKYFRSDLAAWLSRKLGDPKKQEEKFADISPLRHVDQIRIPVFVAGGKDDQTVEITQSKRLISALKKNRVPYETFLVSEEGHGMRHLANQVELYTRIEAFLNQHLKPAAAVAAR